MVNWAEQLERVPEHGTRICVYHLIFSFRIINVAPNVSSDVKQRNFSLKKNVAVANLFSVDDADDNVLFLSCMLSTA